MSLYLQYIPLPSIHAILLQLLIASCITQQILYSCLNQKNSGPQRRCLSWQITSRTITRAISSYPHLVEAFYTVCAMFLQAWHAWAVMNFEAVLHYKHQNQGRDEKKKLRHASDASANSEASNSDSEVDSTDHSPVPSPGQKKVNEVRVVSNYTIRFSSVTVFNYNDCLASGQQHVQYILHCTGNQRSSVSSDDIVHHVQWLLSTFVGISRVWSSI